MKINRILIFYFVPNDIVIVIVKISFDFNLKFSKFLLKLIEINFVNIIVDPLPSLKSGSLYLLIRTDASTKHSPIKELNHFSS